VTNTVCRKYHTAREEEQMQITGIEANMLLGLRKGLGRGETDIDASEDLMMVGT
jgi:hypothetical protein